MTKSPAPFWKAKVMALPSLAHFPFCGVFSECAVMTLPLSPDLVV